jgi:metal transporter CNNM
MMPIFECVGIVICLVHSAMFSGLTIGFFGLSRLKLEVKAGAKDKDALKILRLRKNANFLLATLLWGNVSINVLLTLLTESVLTGFSAFVFSTTVITCFGEIIPQAYFSRHALRVGVLLIPIIKLYQWLLFPISKPTALLLDLWLGKEGIQFFQEKEFLIMLKHHSESADSDVDHLESTGASNFLKLDDIDINEEGEPINKASIISLPEHNGLPVFPKLYRKSNDSFLRRIHESKEKWVIITDLNNEPNLVIDADAFLRDAVYGKDELNLLHYCHRPIIIKESNSKLGHLIQQFKVIPEHAEDDVIDHDIILVWSHEKKIITGADILGRLLRGIVQNSPKPYL